MAIRKYRGMSIEEISSKFYVPFTGAEESGALKNISAKLSRLWQEASTNYTLSEAELSDKKGRLVALQDQLELSEQQVKWQYITQNKVLPTKERYSDSARETVAFINTRSEGLMLNLKTIKIGIQALQEEVAVWKNVKGTLSFIAGRVDAANLNVAVEAKLSAAEPTNQPHKLPTDYTDEGETDLSKKGEKEKTSAAGSFF